MCEVRPTVVRVVDVPATSTLPELHDLLQAALGWTDSHLHEFLTDDARYAVPDDEWDLGDLGPALRDETATRLRELPARFRYRYDFGDGWEHDVEVLGPGAEQPGCRYGEGNCPPEDCGGPGGYAELLAALADPAHPEHAGVRAWVGELADFDQSAADRLVAQTAGAVPDSVRLVLDLAAGGVRLTPGGRLPRSFVRQVQQVRPEWAWDERPASREEDLIPLLALHDVLRGVGLLRLSKGTVRPIKSAADDREVVRRLRSWFEPDGFSEILAGLTVATVAGAGECDGDELASRVAPMLGHTWSIEGRPVTEQDVRRQISGLHSVLLGLDLITYEGRRYRPGPSARTLLPRATALAHRWAAVADQPGVGLSSEPR